MVPQGSAPIFLEVSILVLTDIIAIHLTPGIFLIHTFNTNMYLIHFYGTKIQMHFHNCWVLKL